MSAPVIAPLVNMTPAFPDLEELDMADRPEIAEKAEWLRKHPGRWALVGEREDDMLRGFTDRTARNHGLRGLKRNTGRVEWHYACYPLAGGPTLEETLQATEWLRPYYPADLPELTPDPFAWTPAEMSDAVTTAAEWRAKRKRKPRTASIEETPELLAA